LSGITVFSGATLHLENTKLFDNGEFGQDSDLSEGLATGAILLEVCISFFLSFLFLFLNYFLMGWVVSLFAKIP